MTDDFPPPNSIRPMGPDEDKRMTVGALIRHLSGFPKDMPVLVNGYEDGFDDPVVPRKLAVVDWQGPDCEMRYSGRFQPARREMGEPFDAIVIPRPAGAGDPEYEPA